MNELKRPLPLLERFSTEISRPLAEKFRGGLNRQVSDYLRSRLEILFNASGLDTLERSGKYPYAAASVVNFGVGNLAGQEVSGIDSRRVATRIRQAIFRFEPRINQARLVVRFSQFEGYGGTLLNFIIEGEVDYFRERFAFSLNSLWNTDSGEVQVTPFYVGTVHG
jgi:type VI secretion system protein ImpF